MRKYLAVLVLICLAKPAVASIPGLTTLDGSFQKSGSDDISLKNLPAVRTQGPFPLCSPIITAYALEYQYCKEMKISNCAQLPDNKRISVLDLGRFSIDPNKIKDKTNPDDYPREIPDGNTSPSAMLLNAGLLAESMVPESCAPFDALVNKIQNSSQNDALEEAIWKSFKNAYEQFQKKSLQCAECALQEATTTAKTWKEKYNLKVDNVDMLKAFSAKTYNEFLSQILIPKKCYDVGQDIKVPTYNMEVGTYPRTSKEQNYRASIEKIKSVLRKDQPVIVSNLCLLDPITKDCSQQSDGESIFGTHTLLISGYRKMCNKAGKCYEVLRVQNSWGQTWQDKNNDGWVVADQLLNRTSYKQGVLSWLQRKE